MYKKIKLKLQCSVNLDTKFKKIIKSKSINQFLNKNKKTNFQPTLNFYQSIKLIKKKIKPLLMNKQLLEHYH